MRFICICHGPMEGRFVGAWISHIYLMSTSQMKNSEACKLLVEDNNYCSECNVHFPCFLHIDFIFYFTSCSLSRRQFGTPALY